MGAGVAVLCRWLVWQHRPAPRPAPGRERDRDISPAGGRGAPTTLPVVPCPPRSQHVTTVRPPHNLARIHWLKLGL